MFATLRSRLMLTYSLVIGFVLCVIIVGFLVYLARNPLIDRQDFAHLERVLDAIIPRLSIGLDNSQRIGQAVNRIDELFDVRILVFKPDLTLLVDSRVNISLPLRFEVRRQLEQNRGYVRDTTGKAWLYVTEKTQSGDYIILLNERRISVNVLFLDRIRSVLRDDLLPPVLQIGSVALIIALLFAFWISQWVSSPLQSLSSASRDVASGKYRMIELEGPEEIKKLTKAFNEMSEKVRHTQQSQRDFLANVSHDLNTPLTSIQGFAQAILDGTMKGENEINQAANIIFSESERMKGLVSDLLELARFDAGIIEMNRMNFNLQNLLDVLIENFTLQANTAEIELKSQLDNLPELFGDPDRLYQVFYNLLDNALKFTPRGGSVAVTKSLQGNMIDISFHDTGIGIEPEDVSRIFDRFYQVDKSRKRGNGGGLGLGLSIAQQIVIAHGGSISVIKNHPQGSIFTVKLPTSGDFSEQGSVIE